jgi:CrcB protein
VHFNEKSAESVPDRLNRGADKRIAGEMQAAVMAFAGSTGRLRLLPMASTPQLYASLSVALGGGIGALLRYQLGRLLTHWMGTQAVSTFPWATLAANALGSLLMGVLAGWLARQGQSGDQLRLLLGVGLLGGFTTFSAFSLELTYLIQRGQLGLAGIYLLLSIALGVSGFVFGLTVTRLFA